jgi:hypothetical protein
MSWQMTWQMTTLTWLQHGADVAPTQCSRGCHATLTWLPHGADVVATCRWRGWQRVATFAAVWRWCACRMVLTWQFVTRSDFSPYTLQPIYNSAQHNRDKSQKNHQITIYLTRSTEITKSTDITRIVSYVYNIYHQNHKQIKKKNDESNICSSL